MRSIWHTKKLSETCIDLKLDRAPEGSIPYIEIGDINIDKKNIIFKEKASVKGSIFAPLDSVIVSRVRPARGAISILKKDSAVSSAFTILKPRDFLELKLLFFSLAYSKEFSDYLGKKQKGLLYPSVKESDILNFEISYPESKLEQKRIIKILNEVFEKITKAKENAEKNLQNAKELFESYLQNVFVRIGEGWEENEFGKVIELLTDYHANGSYKTLKANVDLKKTEDYAWMIRSTDFENDFKNDKRYVTKKSYDFLKKSKIFGDEIIISKIGNAGKVYLMPKINRPCSLAMNLFLIRLNKKKCLSEYVYRYLNSKSGQEQIKSRILGTATKTITKDNVRSIKIPFPKSLIEQEDIVKKLNALSEQTKKLEAIYRQKLADLEELKKSVLQKAFAGELVN